MGIFDEIVEQGIDSPIENNEGDLHASMDKTVLGLLDSPDTVNYRISFHKLKNLGLLPEETELKKQIQSINILIREKLSPDKRDALLTERSVLLSKLDDLLDKFQGKA